MSKKKVETETDGFGALREVPTEAEDESARAELMGPETTETPEEAAEAEEAALQELHTLLETLDVTPSEMIRRLREYGRLESAQKSDEALVVCIGPAGIGDVLAGRTLGTYSKFSQGKQPGMVQFMVELHGLDDHWHWVAAMALAEARKQASPATVEAEISGQQTMFDEQGNPAPEAVAVPEETVGTNAVADHPAADEAYQEAAAQAAE